LKQLIAEKSFDRFPVAQLDGMPLGILTRAEAQAAVTENLARRGSHPRRHAGAKPLSARRSHSLLNPLQAWL